MDARGCYFKKPCSLQRFRILLLVPGNAGKQSCPLVTFSPHSRFQNLLLILDPRFSQLISVINRVEADLG